MGQGEGIDTKEGFIVSGEVLSDGSNRGCAVVDAGKRRYLRAPDWVPVESDDGEIEYGGCPQEYHWEESILDLDQIGDLKRTQSLLARLMDKGFQEVTEETGLGLMGCEYEFWTHNRGKLTDAVGSDACELQTCLAERPEAAPYSTLREQLATISTILSTNGHEYQPLLTSAPIVGTPEGMQINPNPYVIAMQQKLLAEYLSDTDGITMAAWSGVLRQFGYEENPLEFFKNVSGSLAPWVCATAVRGNFSPNC